MAGYVRLLGREFGGTDVKVLRALCIPTDADEDVAHYVFDGLGRLILETDRGRIMIDIRAQDVNIFTVDNRGRVDYRLLEQM